MKTPVQLKKYIDSALGKINADLVIKNVRIFHLTDGSVETGDIAVTDGVITGVGDYSYCGTTQVDGTGLYAVPGFLDSHVHLESSMLLPSEYEKLLLAHGVTTAVCDPHELANVLGEEAFSFFAEQSEKLTMDLQIHVSSCVPATPFDTAGAEVNSQTLKKWKGKIPHTALAELMNIPGLLYGDPEVLEKAASFDRIDGHCPLVSGKELNACAAAGVNNCHESTTPAEAQEKLRRGLQVLIREGSASKDLQALIPLITVENSPFLAFCTDDRNPLEITEEGHIDSMIRKAIAGGASPLAAYRVASWSGAQAMGLQNRGLIAPGKRADIVLISDLDQCDVQKVICRGRVLEEDFFRSRTKLSIPEHFLHTVKRPPITEKDLFIPAGKPGKTAVIGIRKNSLITDFLLEETAIRNGGKTSCVERDILKAAVLERHGKNGNTGLGFVRGFGLQKGAIASSVGHDSHNLCCVGTHDTDMVCALNTLREMQGGFVAVQDGKVLAKLPLELGGLLSTSPAEEVNQALKELHKAASSLGCSLPDPFLSLAFITLPVIPFLKLTDRGMFDTVKFSLLEQ